MSFMQFFKRYLLPFAILTGALIIILTNPFANIANKTETTTYSNIQLMHYHKKYASFMHSIHTNLRDHGYALTVDFAMLNDEKVKILIQRLENNQKLKPRESEKIEKSVNQLIAQQHFDPATFQIQLSNSTPSALITANRISYHDLMESIRSLLLNNGVESFRLDYEILPESTEVIIRFADPISEKLKKEIQKMGNDVLEKNNFDSNMVKVIITN